MEDRILYEEICNKVEAEYDKYREDILAKTNEEIFEKVYTIATVKSLRDTIIFDGAEMDLEYLPKDNILDYLLEKYYLSNEDLIQFDMRNFLERVVQKEKNIVTNDNKSHIIKKIEKEIEAMEEDVNKNLTPCEVLNDCFYYSTIYEIKSHLEERQWEPIELETLSNVDNLLDDIYNYGDTLEIAVKYNNLYAVTIAEKYITHKVEEKKSQIENEYADIEDINENEVEDVEQE